MISNLDLKKYFNKDKKYYDSKILIDIIEDITSKSINEIIEKINNSNIYVNYNQIIEYLNNKLITDEPELFKRNEERKKEEKVLYNDENIKDVEQLGQRFIDDLSLHKYSFDPYTLDYYNKYIDIVKRKALLLINIIDKVGRKDIVDIKDVIDDLDINLNENGDISKEDINRLIFPTVFNIQRLNAKVEEANNLDTYLYIKISKQSLVRNGFSEDELYPNKELQTKNIVCNYEWGDVELSQRQKQQLQNKMKENIKSVTKLLLS